MVSTASMYQPNQLHTDSDADNDSPMQETSPSLHSLGFEVKNKASTDSRYDNANKGPLEEEVVFEQTESHFLIPPSFNCSITEETLHDDEHLYVFWANLHLPILKAPLNPMAAVYNAICHSVCGRRSTFFGVSNNFKQVQVG